MKTCDEPNCNWPVFGGHKCRYHQHKRTDKKLKGFNVRKPTGEMDVFLEVWNERPHVSGISGKPLGQYEGTEFFPNLFMHILDKKNYPKYRLMKDNLYLGTPYEHHIIDQGTREQRKKYEEEFDCSFQAFYIKREQLKQQYNESGD